MMEGRRRIGVDFGVGIGSGGYSLNKTFEIRIYVTINGVSGRFK
jgi:hypothetical protein